MKDGGDELHQGLGKIRGYVWMGQGRASPGGMGSLGQMASTVNPQTFLFYAMTYFTETIDTWGLFELAQVKL